MGDLKLEAVYITADTVIVKEVEDELVIITMDDGISNIDSSIYTVNKTGRIIWEKLDGIISLEKIIETLVLEYDVSRDKIEEDVKKLIQEFLEKGLILEKK